MTPEEMAAEFPCPHRGDLVKIVKAKPCYGGGPVGLWRCQFHRRVVALTRYCTDPTLICCLPLCPERPVAPRPPATPAAPPPDQPPT